MLDKKDAKCYDTINQIGQFVTIFMMYISKRTKPAPSRSEEGRVAFTLYFSLAAFRRSQVALNLSKPNIAA